MKKILSIFLLTWVFTLVGLSAIIACYRSSDTRAERTTNVIEAEQMLHRLMVEEETGYGLSEVILKLRGLR